ncbi:flavin-containing monooxygenase [Actinomadura madurae]|uniref:flavin-containing monooxygenase n=1 Tax=Actinomadura madurae TaxID=1993 RepID=UPI0027E23EBA|nr:NAD(P)/FAD-dependent oxidoreductase [Actinomadura madurae]
MTHSVVIIGSGFGGLGMAIRLREAGVHDVVILEKAGGLGGTWRDNTYPGAACDVPSHLYSFSFERKTDWSRRFPPQPEILEYLWHCARKYRVLDKIRFRTEVTEARFDEDAALWRISTTSGTLDARVLVSACGQLNRPELPPIEGRDSFAAPPSIPRAGTTASTCAASGSRWSGRGRARSRSSRRSRRRRRSCGCSSAPRRT